VGGGGGNGVWLGVLAGRGVVAVVPTFYVQHSPDCTCCDFGHLRFLLFFPDIHFGDKACSAKGNETFDCHPIKDETDCLANDKCEWNYSGSGLQYQLLAGPAFIAVFTISSLFSGIISDRIVGYNAWIGRQTLMAAGVITFSVSLFLMGLSTSYWQLVVLRMGIAAGSTKIKILTFLKTFFQNYFLKLLYTFFNLFSTFFKAVEQVRDCFRTIQSKNETFSKQIQTFKHRSSVANFSHIL
jgi:hypothetical protein